MGNVAVLLKKQGYTVAGSDRGIYPPMSNVLKEAGIEMFEGFSIADLCNWKPDRVVVGNAVSRGNEQVEYLLSNRNIPFVSLPELIGKNLIGSRPAVVIAGTHGKTTTTALTAYALNQMKANPGYLVGGVPMDLPSGNEFGHELAPFVIEGDEYDSAFFDKRSKFIHYRPRILILNNLEFDHGDIFRDLEDISRSFSHLLRIVPSNGYILRNGDDLNLLGLPDASWTTTLSVGVGDSNDFRIVDFEEDNAGSRFCLVWHGQLISRVEWKMPGLFNARNLAMSMMGAVLADCLSNHKEIDLKNPFSGLQTPDFSSCKGVKRRQELLIQREELIVLSDFAHHPTAISGTLESLRSRWPSYQLVACFEPRSNTAVTNVFQDRFADALSHADEVIIGAVHRAEKIPLEKRINTQSMIHRIRANGKQGRSFQSNYEVGEYLESMNWDTDPHLVVFFSNGSFDGEIDRFVGFSNQS